MSSQDQPKPGIEQQASESTLGGGMMANQGDNNNQIQDDNNIQQQNNSQAQVNQDNSTGYQTNVDGGTAYIGNNTIIHPQNKPNAAVKEIPYIGVRHFVGRESELAKIHEALHRGKAYAISAVAGMGGVGKTELAIKYARLYEKNYPGGICWFSVRNGNLATEIIQFAQLHLNLQVPQKNFQGNPLSLIQQVTWFWENWQPCQGLVLVVLDDVTDANNFIEYLPKNSRFRVLITTRLRNLDSNIEEILLDALSEKEGLQLFVNLIGSLRVNKESATAREICQWLGYLPLGLELVGRYLAEDFDLSLARMLERLQTQNLQDEAIDIKLQKGQNNYFLMTGKTSIKAAFELSWQELNTPIATVAQLLSLFALDVIPWKFVEFIAKYLNWAEETLDNAKKLLYKLQLIQSAGEGSYKIHPLIREFLQAKLLESGLADNLTLAFATSMAALAKQVPKSPSFVELQNIAPIVPHLTQVAKSMTKYLSDRDLCHPFVCLAKFYEAQGLYKQAEPWRLQCLSEAQSRLCIKHPTVDVAASLHGLAKLYKYQGRYTEAEPLFLQALELRKAIIGEYDQNYTESLYELGELYLPLGRYSEAETLLWKTLELRQNLLGDSHPEIVEGLDGLAMLYSYQGRYSEAELVYEKTLKLKKEFFGDNNLHVANNLYRLALVLARKQWRKKARNSILLFTSDDRRIESLFEQSIDITKRLLGEYHPILAERLRELSLFYYQQKWYRAR
ncbi:hypothetical protein CAL7716_066300 [Calothrix sp. PCC 7716]|nr:hypothetical protein CAL7716_066300 [Calothrix sp. PCC 7716]